MNLHIKQLAIFALPITPVITGTITATARQTRCASWSLKTNGSDYVINEKNSS
ncbi:hypothetical protein MNBD_GAMMA10-629 [hydrothermal vent metagenome]|uniref:Uncharacterized protein n=1 Tax=hydrothermal vent metagenome TaxID=652676 RepID=A0A3B0XPB4_9ZZZZ